jgi:2-polyprenyl-3-methyl-5-hydroxy-6-metoxy-1,4-benzoquinol methylase
MKAIIFAFNDPGSAAMADAVADQLEKGGVSTVTCDYCVITGFSSSRLKRSSRSTLLAISDLGFDSIPRLSARQYEQVCGRDVDFLAVNGWTYASHSYPDRYVLSTDFLNTESAYYQRLRGIAVRIEHLLRAIEPDFIIVQQGSEVISRLIVAKAMKNGMPWLSLESPFFEGYLLLDSVGQHFFQGRNRIDRDWPEVSSRPLTPEQSKHVGEFIDRWRDDRSSKYMQESRAEETERMSRFLKASEGAVVFVPMQVPVDANVHHGIAGFASLADYYRRIIEHLPAGWRAIFKVHPKDTIGATLVPENDGQVLVVRDISIHDLIHAATAIAVFSSNVGLEALLYGKPVIVGGKPYYGRKGLTIDVDTAEQLPSAFENALDWRVNAELRDKLVHYLIEDYLIKSEDTPALLARIDEAIAARTSITDPSRPFSECDPRDSTTFIDFIRRYDELAVSNLTHSEIMARLQTPAFCCQQNEAAANPDQERLQTSAWLSRIERERVARYAFVTSLLAKKSSVLDISCGTGFGSYLLADRALAVVDAIDTSDSAIAYARAHWAHSKVSYRVASPRAFFSRGNHRKYDVAVSFESIERLRNPDLFLDQIWLRIRPGGALFVSVPNCEVYPLLRDKSHIEHYDHRELRAMLMRLPDVEDCHIYWQNKNVFDTTGTNGSRFLIGVAFKKRQGSEWAVAPSIVRAAIPYNFLQPVSDIESLRDVFRMLMRRRRWVCRCLLGIIGCTTIRTPRFRRNS